MKQTFQSVSNCLFILRLWPKTLARRCAADLPSLHPNTAKAAIANKCDGLYMSDDIILLVIKPSLNLLARDSRIALIKHGNLTNLKLDDKSISLSPTDGRA